jgi:hypothetical protein
MVEYWGERNDTGFEERRASDGNNTTNKVMENSEQALRLLYESESQMSRHINNCTRCIICLAGRQQRRDQ